MHVYDRPQPRQFSGTERVDRELLVAALQRRC